MEAQMMFEIQNKQAKRTKTIKTQILLENTISLEILI